MIIKKVLDDTVTKYVYIFITNESTSTQII